MQTIITEKRKEIIMEEERLQKYLALDRLREKTFADKLCYPEFWSNGALSPRKKRGGDSAEKGHSSF